MPPTAAPTATTPPISQPEARPAVHKFCTRRDRNVVVIRNQGVEPRDI
jgi:hypothetical protein